MPQIKISLDRDTIEFVSKFQDYGYSSKSEIIATALADFKKRLDTQALIDSAELYREIYESDADLQELTDDAASICLE